MEYGISYQLACIAIDVASEDDGLGLLGVVGGALVRSDFQIYCAISGTRSFGVDGRRQEKSFSTAELACTLFVLKVK